LVCTTTGLSAAKHEIKNLEVQSVMVATVRLGSSITSELLNLGVLHLCVVCTL
jgi:hypothetical protein